MNFCFKQQTYFFLLRETIASYLFLFSVFHNKENILEVSKKMKGKQPSEQSDISYKVNSWLTLASIILEHRINTSIIIRFSIATRKVNCIPLLLLKWNASLPVRKWRLEERKKSSYSELICCLINLAKLFTVGFSSRFYSCKRLVFYLFFNWYINPMFHHPK